MFRSVLTSYKFRRSSFPSALSPNFCMNFIPPNLAMKQTASRLLLTGHHGRGAEASTTFMPRASKSVKPALIGTQLPKEKIMINSIKCFGYVYKDTYEVIFIVEFLRYFISQFYYSHVSGLCETHSDYLLEYYAC